jgi:hypothetical protein
MIIPEYGQHMSKDDLFSQNMTFRHPHWRWADIYCHGKATTTHSATNIVFFAVVSEFNSLPLAYITYLNMPFP